MATKLGWMLTYFDGLLPITSQGSWSFGLAKSRDKLNPLYLLYFSAYGQQTCKLLTYFEGLFSYGHKTLNQVVSLEHVTIWKSLLLNLVGCWLRRVGSARKCLSRHRHLFVSFLFFPALFLYGLAKVICVFFFYCCFKRVWPGSDFLIWYAVCKSCPLEIKNNDRFKRDHMESCSSTTKNISPLAQCLWPSNLARCWLIIRCSNP